jgi:serine/threonine protein kinase
MAPEYLYRGEISTKSDIYSLGMLILEITTGEKSGGNDKERSARHFVLKVRCYMMARRSSNVLFYNFMVQLVTSAHKPINSTATSKLELGGSNYI